MRKVTLKNPSVNLWFHLASISEQVTWETEESKVIELYAIDRFGRRLYSDGMIEAMQKAVSDGNLTLVEGYF